jgi:hypothetical protein
MVQVFRRDKSFYEAARLRLYGLDPDGRYSLTDLDSSASSQATGRQLADEGFLVTLKDQPQAAVFLYQLTK